jgi:hypothetical protein
MFNPFNGIGLTVLVKSMPPHWPSPRERSNREATVLKGNAPETEQPAYTVFKDTWFEGRVIVG